MALKIVEEANKCLNCKRPMCRKGCPIDTPIPDMIQLFKQNKVMEAGKQLFENNPLSAVCAIVCDHGMQCSGHCVLNRKGSPVHFYEIEQYVSGMYLDRMRVNKAPMKKKRVAVIGSGPAGITVAVILASNGYPVTIFEERSRMGGMLRYGIPDFRLPKSMLDKYRDRMQEMGIQIRPNIVIGTALTIENLFRDGYSTVFIGSGVWRPKNLGIEGECYANVHFGISYLLNPQACNIGERVAVIGVGNVAMDVARTAFRNGAHEVIMFARSGHMSASTEEIEYARLDGAEIRTGLAIEEITEEGPVFRKNILNDKGDIVETTDERELVKVDTTIIAASQAPKDKLVITTHGLEADEKGLLKVDEKNRTTREGVYAAGDVVLGPKTVVHAVADAKRAAYAMMEYMEGRDKAEEEGEKAQDGAAAAQG